MLGKMTHTALICHIIDELRENNFTWETNIDLFYIFLPNYDYNQYRSNWNHWINKQNDTIRSEEIRSEISKTFKLDNKIWNLFTKCEQKDAVAKAIKEFVNPLPKDIKPDFSELLPLNKPLTQEQQKLLEEIEQKPKEEIEMLLLKTRDFLEKTLENQNFLLNLLEPLYNCGMYDFLNQYLFTALLPHNLNEINIKVIHANTLGSLTTPNYLEAWSILNTISYEDVTPEIMHIKTILISNLRRYELEKDTLTKEKLHDALPIFRQFYTQIFENKKEYNYYPAINLMYILKLSLLTTSNPHNITLSDFEELYRDSKASLKKELNSSYKEAVYYSNISNIEFQLLLEQYHVKQELEFLLDSDHPSVTWVYRTLRQLKFFTKIVKNFSQTDTTTIIKEFNEVIELLEDYIDYQD